MKCSYFFVQRLMGCLLLVSLLGACDRSGKELTLEGEDARPNKVNALVLWASFNAVTMNDNTLVLVGDQGTIVRSADGGKSWQPVASGTHQSLSAVVRESQELVVVGTGGAIVRSADGAPAGNRWQEG
jgi:hypothetical protein